VATSYFVTYASAMGCPDGSDKVRCLIDPCKLKHCPNNFKCVADYCGGCHGRCGCKTDADCSQDAEALWCRDSGDAAAGHSCTPFQQVGTPCTPPAYEPRWLALHCAAGLECADEFYCRTKCNAEHTCDSTTDYCGSGTLCRPNGSCATSEDCLNRFNLWSHDRCLGFANCDAAQCTWKCL